MVSSEQDDVTDAKPSVSTGLGWALTAIWCAAWFVGVIIRFDTLQKLSWNSIGDVAAGFAAPLAFLWLVVGYYLQRQELRLQRGELRLQREALRLQREESARQTAEMQRQAEAIRGNEQHARMSALLQLLEVSRHDLAMRAAHIAANLQNAQYVEILEIDRFLKSKLDAYHAGDRDIFFRLVPDAWAKAQAHAKLFAEIGASGGKSQPSDGARILTKVSENQELLASAMLFDTMYENIVGVARGLNDGEALIHQIENTALGLCHTELKTLFPEIDS